MDYKKLGAAIGAALKKSELSANVGEFCGVTTDAVRGWADKGCRPDDRNMHAYFRLIKALKIDVSEFSSLETPAGRVTFLRFKNELSVGDLTKLICKKSTSTVSHIECGRKTIIPKVAAYLAPALNTTPDYILNGDAKVEPRNGLVELPTVENKPIESGVKEFIEISTRTIGGEEVNSVSARDLYLDLGLNEVNWSRWSQTNIVENMFFKDGEDFISVFIVKSEKGRGNSAQDYAVTIEMAKHLAMMAKTQRAHDYRNYFIACEKAAPLPTVDHLSPEVLLAMKSARNFAKLAGASKREADVFVNEEMKRLHGINAIKLVTGSLNEQMRLRLVK